MKKVARIRVDAIENILTLHEEIQSRFRGREMPDGYIVPTRLIDDLQRAYNESSDCDVDVALIVDTSTATVVTDPNT